MNDTTFKAKLSSVLKDNLYDREVSNLRSGRLDTKKLMKISYSSKLFKKKQERKGKHYSVCLLVDSSGSMHGERERAATEAAKKIATHFDKAGVDLQIISYNTFRYVIKDFGQKLPPLGKIGDEIKKNVEDGERIVYCRSCKVILPYDDGGEKHDDECEDAFTSRANQGNCDGEIMNFARNDLKNRKGGKIVIVLSDGKPHFDHGMNGFQSYNNPKMKYSDYNLKSEVDKAIREGISFIGIGIETNRIEKYYPKKNTVVLWDMDELYPSIVNKLSALIKRG